MRESHWAIRCWRTAPHCRRTAHLVSSPAVTNVTAGSRPMSSASSPGGSCRFETQGRDVSVEDDSVHSLGQIGSPGRVCVDDELFQFLIGLKDTFTGQVIGRLNRADTLRPEKFIQGGLSLSKKRHVVHVVVTRGHRHLHSSIIWRVIPGIRSWVKFRPWEPLSLAGRSHRWCATRVQVAARRRPGGGPPPGGCLAQPGPGDDSGWPLPAPACCPAATPLPDPFRRRHRRPV